MDDNIWEYPFGDLDDEYDDDIFARGANLKRPALRSVIAVHLPALPQNQHRS